MVATRGFKRLNISRQPTEPQKIIVGIQPIKTILTKKSGLNAVNLQGIVATVLVGSTPVEIV